MNNNLYAIKSIAEALGEIRLEVVFVGGAVVELYINDKAAPTPQPSEDVDCIVELLTYSDWIKFERRLRDKGFKDYDTSNEDLNPPTCRKYILGMKVDFMPVEEKVLGYANPWFKKGLANAIEVSVENTKIYIFRLDYFLATKFQAFLDRGRSDDIRFSQDLEDLTELFDGVTDIEQRIINSSIDIKAFLKETVLMLIEDKDIVSEAMYGFLGYDDVSTKHARVDRIFSIFNNIII